MSANITDKIIKLLKKIPIDLGQESMNTRTKGKEIAFNLVENGNNKTALDVGCRKGVQTKKLEKEGYQVISIDIEKNFERCMVVDVNNTLPFNDNTFDLIWCSEVIEHLKNPRAVADDFRRVLKKDGQMILTTPNSYFIIQKILTLFGLPPERVQRQDHLHYFDEKEIKSLFPQAQIFGYFPYFLLRRKIKKMIGLLSPTFVICERKQ